MSDFDTTHEIIKTEDLGKPLSKSGNEWRYYCTSCEEKRGKPDKKGKMYFNIEKQTGYCFLCHTAFHVEDEELDKEEREWDNILDTMKSRFPLSIFDGMERPKGVGFTFPELSPSHIKYLKNRNPYLVALKDWLGIRGWTGKDSGVVLPFFYRENVCKYQVRFIDRAKGAKYYTAPGPKPLYSPMHILNTFQLEGDTQEVTICEGVFDAIALWIIGFPTPLSLLGDKITPLQLYDIRSLSPMVSKAYVCLDDWDRSLAVSRVMRRYIPSLQETKIYSQWGGGKNDPEDFLRLAIQDPLVKKEYTERVTNFLRKVNEK